jgi:signal transduction histidine kinase
VAESDIQNSDILIVDDALPNLRLLSRMLKDSGFQVRGISNSSMVTTVVHAEPPDLILLDINMPGLSGYEVCAQLKADERTHEIPVIFISALDDVLDKVRAFSVGGIDYITKPFQVEEVLARVRTHLTVRRLQQQLESQIAELQESNNELNAFAHTVAHDLKNPLASMVLNLDLLEMWVGLDEKEKSIRAITVVQQSMEKLTNIIDEILLLASVRKETVEMVPLDTAGIVAQAISRLSLGVETTQARIEAPDEWPVALGYEPWVEEVWMNYLSNGLKHGGTPPFLQLGADVQPDGMIRYWVRDHGPGIASDVVPTLFAEFTRVGQARTGHGLGLSIVKRIVDKLDGEVGLECHTGGGCTFFFTLPAA